MWQEQYKRLDSNVRGQQWSHYVEQPELLHRLHHLGDFAFVPLTGVENVQKIHLHSQHTLNPGTLEHSLKHLLNHAALSLSTALPTRPWTSDVHSVTATTSCDRLTN